MTTGKPVQNEKARKVKKADNFKLVISQEFADKYEKCKIQSCITKDHIYQLQFYKDNHCMLATLENVKGEVLCRAVLWGPYYIRAYCAKGYQRAFITWLKRAGFIKGTGNLTYPIKKIKYLPFLDNMCYFNADFTLISNECTKDFMFTRSWETRAKCTLGQSIMYSCPMCENNSYLSKIMVDLENEKMYCPQCFHGKPGARAEDILEGIDTIDWQDASDGDEVTYKNCRSGIDNLIYKSIIKGKHKKLVFCKANPKGVYK